MSDVVESRQPRTYPLPQSVVVEAEQGRRWQRAYDVEVDSSAQWASAFLASGGSVTAEIVGVLANLAPERPELERPGDPSYPSTSRIRWSLYGGDSFARWSSKIIATIKREDQSAIAASLESIGYDEKSRYIGLAYSTDPSLVRALIRVDRHDPTIRSEWTGQEWRELPVTASFADYETYELSPDLIGIAASALTSAEGLMMKFATPVARLSFEPLIAAAPLDPDVPAGAHYYAVVDPTDRTAVMNLITISPGPVVKVRDGGKWTDGAAVLTQLMSVAPPPLVELNSQSLQMVIAQIDGTVDDAETNPDYVESLGNEKEIEAKQADDAVQQGKEFAAKRAASQAVAASGEKDTSSVIVALPVKTDPIHDIGPEQKHATLLWFGEIDDASALHHAVKSLISTNSMPFAQDTGKVEELGEDDPRAVVLKLSNDGPDLEYTLENIRDTLLEDQDVKKLWSAQKQYPSFTPHVTLGYGDDVSDDDRSAAEQVPSVTFDRLAVWHGDDQTEYPLTRQSLTASVSSIQRERDRRLVEIERQIFDVRARDAQAREDFDRQMDSVRASGVIEDERLAELHSTELERRKTAAQSITDGEKLYESESQRYRKLIIEEALQASALLRQRTLALSLVASAQPVDATELRVEDVQSHHKTYHHVGRGPVVIRWGCIRGEAS